MRISPCEIDSSPAIILSVVDLPQPDGPTNTTKLAFLDLKVDAFDGELPAIDLDQLLQADMRRPAHPRVAG